MFAIIAGVDGESRVSKTIVPEGWSYAAIGDLFTLINGKAFKPSEWADSGLPIIRIQNLNNLNAKFNHFSGDVAPKFIVEHGELLFAWSGTPGTSFGAHIWNGEKAILNQHIFRVLFNEIVIDKTFFRIAINQKLQELIDKAHGGVGLRHVTKGKFEHTEILLPPLNEQRRIVAKIEALKARSQKAKEALEAIPFLLDQFRQSVLTATFRGDLTADWREKNPDVEPASVLLERIQEKFEHTYINTKKSNQKTYFESSEQEFLNDNFEKLPVSWQLTQIRKVCISSFYGPRFGKNEYVVDGIPSIRTTDMTDEGEIILQNPPKINILKDKLDNFKVLPGDLLVTRSGSIGAMAVFRDNYIAIPSAYLIRFRFSHLVNVDYVFYYLKSPIGQKLLGLNSTAVTQANINAEAIKTIPIPIPPLEEQKEIVYKIQSIFKNIAQFKQQYQQAQVDLDLLDQSILAKAFRGELVPQDPNDEPASILLERIQAERAKRESKGKPAKKSTGKTTGQRSRKAKQQDSESTQLGLPGLE